MTTPPAPAPAPARTLTRAEIEAIPTSFPATLVEPRDGTFTAMYERWTETNPADVARILSWNLRIEHVSIPVTIEECGKPSAYYPLRTKTIHICYELVAYANELRKRPRGEADVFTNHLVMFATLHEVAHALIHVLGLPVDGNEEDLADELALLTMTDYHDAELARTVLETPRAFFARHGDTVTAAERDEHSAGAQRSLNAACILYGRHRDARAKRLLGKRADACIESTTALIDRWNDVLRPYSRIKGGKTF